MSAYARLIGEAWDLVVGTQDARSALVGIVTGIFTSYFKATVERSMMTANDAEQRRFIALAQAHFVMLLGDMSGALEPLRSTNVASRHIPS